MTKIFVMTPWSAGKQYHQRLTPQSPGCSGKWGDIEACDNFDEADYYIAFWCGEPLLRDKCRPHSIINVMNESSYYIPDSRKIGNETFTSRWITDGPNPLTWWVEKSYSELNSQTFPEKTKLISYVTTGRYLSYRRQYALRVLSAFNGRFPELFKRFGMNLTSELNIPKGHRYRINFLKKFTKTFPGVLDIYGKNVGGFDLSTIKGYLGPATNKWYALSPYRYSFAFENVYEKNYFTEKIIDCILSGCMPIYFGCTNLGDFLPKNSFVELDITKRDSIYKARDIIKSDFREKNLDALSKAKDLILNKYQFWPTIEKIIHNY